MLLLACACLLAPIGAAAAEPDQDGLLAAHLLDLSGRHAGLCSLPRAGAGALALALAGHAGLLVHALAPELRNVDDLRQRADAAGFLGRSLYIDQGDAAHDPLADWCADLVVVADAADADLEALSAPEALRTLSPYRGMLVVGRAKALGPGLSRERLAAWAAKLDLAEARVVADDQGLWAVARARPLAGGDDWGHWTHGPDLNRVSTDTVLKWPVLPQWLGLPYHAESRVDINVIAGGRRFHARNTMANNGYEGEGRRKLTAQSAYNGAVLWRRDLPDTFGIVGSLMVATPEALYLKDGNGALVLDAETGAERGRIAFSDDPGLECKWLLFADGVLVAVLGPAPQIEKGKGLSRTLDDSGRGADPVAARQSWFLGYDSGTLLAAADASARTPLWKRAAASIDPSKTGIAGGRVFAYEDDARAICLDLRTGAERWTTAAPIAKPHGGKVGYDITFILTFRPDALITPDVYFINSFSHFQVMSFAASDGALLCQPSRGRTNPAQEAGGPWSNLTPGLVKYPVAMEGGILGRDAVLRDPRTLKPLHGLKDELTYAGCGPFTVSPNVISGTCGVSYDRLTQHRIMDSLTKSGCENPSLIADGLALKFASGCVGCTEWSGTIAECSAGQFPLHQSAATADRLVHGQGRPPASAEKADPAVWPSYRADESRRGSSSATLPDHAGMLWSYVPNPPCKRPTDVSGDPDPRSTAAVCVGDRILFGTAEGCVRCRDRRSGGALWSYPTGGRVASSPTVEQGLVYAGSGDGYAYCLDLAEGRLVWRYRIAPKERRIMVYGRLMSAWPALPSVLVHDGVAYAAAGLIGAYSGTSLCALDARTGEPKWERADLGIVPGSNANRGYNADGQMAWGRGRLWLHGGDGGVVAIDPATGSPTALGKLLAPSWNRPQKDGLYEVLCFSRGQDIGVVGDRLLVLGGIQTFTSFLFDQERNSAAIFPLADDGTVLPPNKLVDDKLPVWDGNAAVVTGGKNVSLELLAPDALAIAPAKDKPRPGRRIPTAGNLTYPTRCRALAANAVVVASMSGPGWLLEAFARDGGQLLWKVALPGEPAYNGVAISRGGEVVASLLDGRVVAVGAP